MEMKDFFFLHWGARWMSNVVISSEMLSMERAILGDLQLIECMRIYVLSLAYGLTFLYILLEKIIFWIFLFRFNQGTCPCVAFAWYFFHNFSSSFFSGGGGWGVRVGGGRRCGVYHLQGVSSVSGSNISYPLTNSSLYSCLGDITSFECSVFLVMNHQTLLPLVEISSCKWTVDVVILLVMEQQTLSPSGWHHPL